MLNDEMVVMVEMVDEVIVAHGFHTVDMVEMVQMDDVL